MIIHVTAEAASVMLNSRAGHKPESCPVATALIEAGFDDVFVTTLDIRLQCAVKGRRRRVYIDTPPEARQWLKRFDARREPGALTFNLPLPGEDTEEEDETD